jgi:hypothetical protein
MNRRRMATFATMAMLGIVALPGSAPTQEKSLKDQLLGTWTLVSLAEVYPDGRRENPWGPMLKGAVNFDSSGKVMLMLIGADLPNPTGKPQESGRMVVAYFGTYAVDEAAKTVTYTAERATTPAFDGLARKANVTVTGDELQQASAPVTGPQGTFTPNLVFRRAK